MRAKLGFGMLPTRREMDLLLLLSVYCVGAEGTHIGCALSNRVPACQPACLFSPAVQGSSVSPQLRINCSEQQQGDDTATRLPSSPRFSPSFLSSPGKQLRSSFRALRGGMDPDTLPSDYELSKEDVFGASDADSDDPSASSSSFDTEQDDPRPHEAITTPILHIYQTPHYQIPFLEVWPGDGAVPSAGDRLRVRWNIAKHMISLYDAEFGGYGRPWKGDWKAEGGSWKWPEDEAFEFVFRQDPRVAPGVEEVLASMRQGGRRHCLIKPKFGFTVQDGVVYDKPFPSDTHERTLLIKWLGKHFFDPKSLRQRQPLAWELDLELVERPRPGRPGQRTAFKLDASAQLEPS